jgi:hypothetical protein
MLLAASFAQGYYGAGMKPTHALIAIPKSDVDEREKEWKRAHARRKQ